MKLTLDQRIELAEKRVERCLEAYADAFRQLRESQSRERAARRKHTFSIKWIKMLRKARERMTG